MPLKGLSLIAGLGLTALMCISSPALAQSLGAASSSAVEGAAGVTAAGGAGTVIGGDVGSSPNASITGFPPALVVPPFGIHANDGAAIAAQAADTALFINLSAGACTDTPIPQMSGANFGPGIHCFSSTADLAASGNMTLTGAGVYIFRVPTGLTANVSSTVTLNGVNPCNVFWQVGSAAVLNGAIFVGNVVAQAGVTLGVGASLTGRALATVGPVTLSGSNTVGGCSVAAPPSCPTITLLGGLPEGIVGVPFGGSPFSPHVNPVIITASGGSAPFTFSVVNGALPVGLTLFYFGLLGGTPTTAGSYTFTIRGSDATGCFRDVSYTITVLATVPTLSQWAMIALALLLVLAAVTAMRRRNM
jgi:hypothetical protein